MRDAPDRFLPCFVGARSPPCAEYSAVLVRCVPPCLVDCQTDPYIPPTFVSWALQPSLASTRRPHVPVCPKPDTAPGIRVVSWGPTVTALRADFCQYGFSAGGGGTPGIT